MNAKQEASVTDRDGLDRLMQELQREGIRDPRVLAALRKVPRELFVPPEYRAQALRNVPLPIGEGQTISQPYVVALMTQTLALAGTEKVLEVGTGSGYQCAILAELSRKVVSIERIASLAEEARHRLVSLGYGNVELVVGDGSLGYPEEAPYDAIVVTAGSPRVPQPLVEQLGEGGRLILPVGSPGSQELLLYRKIGGTTVFQRHGAVRFVPLLGREGWREREASLFRDEPRW